MAVIGVYDYDFMTHTNVIPSLECAKLVTYLTKKKQICALMPKLEPEKFSQTFYRKDFDDGKVDHSIFANPKIEYGGLAFTGNRYLPLKESIELTVPDFNIYANFQDRFLSPIDQEIFKRSLKCKHIRFSLDGSTIWEKYRQPVQHGMRTRAFIVHDANLNHIEGVIPKLMQICNSKRRDYRSFGIKFPMIFRNEQEIRDWAPVLRHINLLQGRYNGTISADTLQVLRVNGRFAWAQGDLNFEYNVATGSHSEDDFIMNALLEIYKQVLFLRTGDIQLSLVIDNNFPISQELENLITLFNLFIRGGWQETNRGTAHNITLVEYLKGGNMEQISPHRLAGTKIRRLPNLENARDSFRYIQQKNPKLFQLFYTAREAYYHDGGIYYEQY